MVEEGKKWWDFTKEPKPNLPDKEQQIDWTRGTNLGDSEETPTEEDRTYKESVEAPFPIEQTDEPNE